MSRQLPLLAINVTTRPDQFLRSILTLVYRVDLLLFKRLVSRSPLDVIKIPFLSSIPLYKSSGRLKM